ncbi:hypothetical protein [Planctomyces sp. SH-PL62]|uniref:hypothetical protein n=1 Tax=Planctomyces sp. SH-PL62 TaxID=1636152 RepID=UPI00078E1FBB|nr:hypothetical protein [Planctomyces sp. SH-PL62]AMV37765.1 hypothetical protein VT85_10035 [Planctomyces sp. SH-PL62]
MDEPRTVSKTTFGCLSLLISLVLCFAVCFGTMYIAWIWRISFEPGVLGGLSVLYLALSRVAADTILRRFGLSRSGMAVEIHGRPPFGAYDDGPPEDVAEAHVPRGLVAFILIGAPIMGLFFLASSWVFERNAWMWWLVIGMGCFFLVIFVVNLLDLGKPQARVDLDGVTGYPSHRAMVRRFVPWIDVFSCEVQTIYDTFGKPVLLRPILKGRDGETLMKLALQYTPMVEQDRIVKAIKARLPESEVESWPM